MNWQIESIYQKMDDSYLELDFHHIPCRAEIYHKGELKRKWSVENPLELVNTVIDGLESSGFEKIKIKATVKMVADIFEPKKIRVVEKE